MQNMASIFNLRRLWGTLV